jgi:hypothetical protein
MRSARALLAAALLAACERAATPPVNAPRAPDAARAATDAETPDAPDAETLDAETPVTPDAETHGDAPDAPDGACLPGLTHCGGERCSNLATDTFNCGACGRRCVGVEACAGGRCVGEGSACGEGGYPCCTGDGGAPCVTPLVCMLGICTAAERPCGHRGEACCPGALQCEEGTTCSDAGCQ